MAHCVPAVCMRVCVCMGACMQPRACVPTAGMCLRAPPSSSLPCMQHPSMTTEKPSVGGTGVRGCGAERAGGVNPPRSAASPTFSAILRPLRWCSSVAAIVLPIISWCGGTSRRPGRKSPILHGRRQGPTGPARPPFHPPSSRVTPAKLFVEPCPGAGGGRGWAPRWSVSATKVWDVPARCSAAPGLAAGPKFFVHCGSREGRAGGGVGGPGPARGPRLP